MNKKINHKQLWVDSMIGMTWGFFATLIVGTIIGLLGIEQHNWWHDLTSNVKHVLAYITPLGIGIGIGIKLKLKPMEIFAIGIGAFIVGHSNVIPSLSGNTIDMSIKGLGIRFPGKWIPGDVFGSWIAGVLLVYLFKVIKLNTFIDIIIVPLIGFVVGVLLSFFLTYSTTLVLILIEWMINNTLNLNHIAAIFLAPILGMLMGLALSLPTSSAAIAMTLSLHGDAATAAMAATAAQMVTFGVMTYMSTRKVSQSLAVMFGSSMLQMPNFSKRPLLLLLPTLMSGLMAMLAVSMFNLDFAPRSVTPGMGTAALYGQIFTLEENGWGNLTAWMNVIFMQLVIPFVLSVLICIPLLKKDIIKKNEMELTNA